MRLIPFSDLKPKKDISYCRDHIRRLSKAGLFPKPLALSIRRIAFVEEEIDAWVAKKIAACDGRAIEEEVDQRLDAMTRASDDAVAG